MIKQLRSFGEVLLPGEMFGSTQSRLKGAGDRVGIRMMGCLLRPPSSLVFAEFLASGTSFRFIPTTFPC